MKLYFSYFILIVGVILLSPVNANAQGIDQDSSYVAFEISNLGLNTVKGTISGFEGDVLFDSTDLSKSTFDICIDPTTLNSGISARDKTLLEEEYFSVKKYPRICYNSENIVKTNKGFLSKGTLKLKGISREVTIPFIADGNKLTGNIEINRLEYGIGPKGGFLIGKIAKLTIVCLLNAKNP